MPLEYSIEYYRGDSPLDEENERYPLEEGVEEIGGIIEAAISKAYDELEVERRTDILVCRTESDIAKNHMYGIKAKDFAYLPDEGEDLPDIRIEVNRDVEGWQDCLEAVTAHEYAHIWYSENRDPDMQGIEGGVWPLNWETTLREGHAMLSAEELVDFETPWREPETVDIEDIELENVLVDLHDTNYQELFYGKGSDRDIWMGYALAYAVGQEMVGEPDDRMEGIKSLVDRSEEEVIETVEEVVGTDS